MTPELRSSLDYYMENCFDAESKNFKAAKEAYQAGWKKGMEQKHSELNPILILEDGNNEWPEDDEYCLWWYKGEWEDPYVGMVVDCNFPGIDKFFAWTKLPLPTNDFWKEYNPI